MKDDTAKPAPAQDVANGSPWERLDRAFRTVLTVPKAALLKAEAKGKRARMRKRERLRKATT